MAIKVLDVTDRMGEGCNCAVVDFTAKLAKEIKRISAVCSEHGIHVAEIFSYDPDFYNVDEVDEIEETPIYEDLDGSTFADEDAVRVDGTILNITDHDFWWSTYVKHTSSLLETARIPISSLDELAK